MQIKDGNADAKKIFDRHYSKYHYKDGRDPSLFCGPGEKIVLVTPGYDALWVWRKFKDNSGQTGVNCAVFRNEGTQLSSYLILKAEEYAWHRWPNERLYTYISTTKIRSSNPGYCYLMAGWQKCGVTKVNKLIIMEKYPDTNFLATVGHIGRTP